MLKFEKVVIYNLLFLALADYFPHLTTCFAWIDEF
jgi:hypothetical protein